MAIALHTHLPENKSVMYIIILVLVRKQELGHVRSGLVLSAVHVIRISARKQQSGSCLSIRIMLGLLRAWPSGLSPCGRHGSGVVSHAVGL